MKGGENMTDNEKRAHDLALTIVQEVLSRYSDHDVQNEYEMLKAHDSDENIFTVYVNHYREFLYRINHLDL